MPPTDNAPANAPKKFRKTELVTPPNTLKQKVGSGGLDPGVIAAAEKKIVENVVDFRPIAQDFLEDLTIALDAAARGANGEPAIEAMIYPAMQLKSQGSMFRFPLVTDISDILITFLETVPMIDKDVLDVVNAHKKALTAALENNLSGTGGAPGKALKDSLMDACGRYHRRHTQEPAK